MRTGILIALLAASTACAAPPSAQFREKLAANLGKVETVEAAFIQNRRLKSLDMTLAITGRLALEKGKRMAWLVREPMRYMCVISEQGLAQWDGDSGEVLKLSAKRIPWLRLIYGSLSGWLSADLDALEKEFTVETSGERSLRLTPLDAGFFKEYVKTVEFEFGPGLDRVERLRIVEKNGDEMEIVFRDVVNNQPIPGERWQLPPPSNAF